MGIFTCRLNPGCNVSRPHVHQEDGAVIYVGTEMDADRYLASRAQRDQILEQNAQQPPQDPGWRYAGRKYRSMKR